MLDPLSSASADGAEVVEDRHRIHAERLGEVVSERDGGLADSDSGLAELKVVALHVACGRQLQHAIAIRRAPLPYVAGVVLLQAVQERTHPAHLELEVGVRL